MSTPEGLLKKKIKAYLDTLDGIWFFSPMMNGYGRAGIPDFIGCYRGMFFAIEAKAPNGVATKNQVKEMVDIHKAHGLVTLVYDVEGVKDLMERGKGWLPDPTGLAKFVNVDYKV